MSAGAAWGEGSVGIVDEVGSRRTDLIRHARLDFSYGSTRTQLWRWRVCRRAWPTHDGAERDDRRTIRRRADAALALRRPRDTRRPRVPRSCASPLAAIPAPRRSPARPPALPPTARPLTPASYRT